MDTKKLKLALMKINNNESKIHSGRSIKLPRNLSRKKGKTFSNYNNNNSKITNSINSICSQKKYNFSISPNKLLNLSSDIYPNNTNNVDLLKENLLKTKEMCNEQSNELFKLKLKYNKLYQFHEDNLKILQSIINKAGINANLNNLNKEEILNLTNNCDFSNIISQEEKENLKGKHLISCFKTKILEYQYLLDKKSEEISKIKNSSRILKMSKLESDNACKSLENINLSKEKQKLNEKILSMENIMGSLNTRCQKLEKNENKNINNIGELQNKIRNLLDEISLKDKIIEKLNKRIIKNKEDNKSFEKKIKSLEQEINQFQKDKQIYKKFISQKEQYEINDENMKKKIETMKSENEKLTQNLNLVKTENNNYILKYDSIQKEKEKFLLNKEEVKNKNKEKEKQIKLLDEQFKKKENLITELTQKMDTLQKSGTNSDDNIKKINHLYKEKELNYIEIIDLLKQKILKLDEKNNLYNKIIS